MSTAPGNTGIEITAKHSILAWILIFFKPTFVVDGHESKQAWKTPTFVPTAPASTRCRCTSATSS